VLKIVEGLNGAGKSTVIKRWIDKGLGELVPIPLPIFANNVRWNEVKRPFQRYKATQIKGNQDRVSLYNFAVFETILFYVATKFERGYSKELYLDRSFLSGLVYNSINIKTFDLLIDYYQGILGDKLEFVYLDTDIEMCIERRRKTKGKEYAILDPEEQYRLDMKYKNTFKYYENIKFTLSKEGEEE